MQLLVILKVTKSIKLSHSQKGKEQKFQFLPQLYWGNEFSLTNHFRKNLSWKNKRECLQRLWNINHACKQLDTHQIPNAFRKSQKNHLLLPKTALLSERNLNLESTMYAWEKKLLKNLNASKSILNVPDSPNGTLAWWGIPGNPLDSQVPEEGETSGCEGFQGPVPDLDQIPCR